MLLADIRVGRAEGGLYLMDHSVNGRKHHKVFPVLLLYLPVLFKWPIAFPPCWRECPARAKKQIICAFSRDVGFSRSVSAYCGFANHKCLKPKLSCKTPLFYQGFPRIILGYP